MKILLLLPLICTAFVLQRVWFTDNNMKLGSKLVWSVAALLFNFLTLIAFLIAQPHKK